jgi:hypothetical protein
MKYMVIHDSEIRIVYLMFTADNSMRTRAIFHGAKQPGHEANPLLPSSSEVKNEWSCTSIAPVCLHGMYRDSCTFVSISSYVE